MGAVTKTGRGSPRSQAPFTADHLQRLADIALADQEAFFARNPHLTVYRDRLLLIALCQGGGMHYLDGLAGSSRKTGVKDLDVYCFYAAHPRVAWPYRRHGKADFGPSEFGYYITEEGHPFEHNGERFTGRPVDILGRSLPVRPSADPVAAVRSWLRTNNTTPAFLRWNGVIGLYPHRYRGEVIWNPAEDNPMWGVHVCHPR